MFKLYCFILIFFIAHFIGDYLLQSDDIAKRKSKEIKALLIHTGIIGGCFFAMNLIGLLCFGFQFNILNILFIPLMNYLLHLITDYFTSKWASSLYSKDIHYYYVVLGLDQLIHYVIATLSVGLFIAFQK